MIIKFGKGSKNIYVSLYLNKHIETTCFLLDYINKNNRFNFIENYFEIYSEQIDKIITNYKFLV